MWNSQYDCAREKDASFIACEYFIQEIGCSSVEKKK